MTVTGTGWNSLARPALLFIAALIYCGGLLAAHDADLPESSESAEDPTVAVTIDAEHLIELYQYIADLLIIDSRHAEDYVLGHIETSINLPLAETNCKALRKLAKSTEQAIVLYSNNNMGDATIEAIRIASGCGYKRLFWLRGGFVEWKDKDYPYVIE
jgi:rhodanese-related sulfurtransferase